MGYLEKNSDWDLHWRDAWISGRSDGAGEDSSSNPMKKRQDQGSRELAEGSSTTNNNNNKRTATVD